VTGLALLAAAPAAAAPSLSTDDRLDDRRYAAVGDRAYIVGTEAGRFPAMGFHTRGEMGGIWAQPIKLLDGIWFSIDGQPVGHATRFTSGYGHVRMDLPDAPGLALERIDFAPDGRRAALIGLRMRATGGDRELTVGVDAHSELMSAYPWGETTPSQLTVNGQDTAAADAGRLRFAEGDWTALVGAARAADAVETGSGFRGPQDPPVICPPSGQGQPPAPPRCDDTAYGKGAGGRLTYELTVPAGRTRTLWIAAAATPDDFAAALRDPAAALRRKVAHRERLARLTRLSLPDDPLLAEGIDWSKQNLADSVQVAHDLQVREVRAGKEFPPPSGTVARVRFLGAGWPDYPWLFATDGEYTAFASVALGQFEPIADHLIALRDVSRVANGETGKVVHEVVHDGSVYFGANEDEGNTDETVKFPSAVALLWRWTGDDRLRDELYDFAVDGMRWATTELDADGDGWLEGPGNVEREGMGEEKLDVAVYTIRGLRDLADLARSKGDRATAAWASGRARALASRFEDEWWMPEVPQHADSLDDPGNVKLQQRHWIGAVPMEAGIASREHALEALRLRETDCYTGPFGLFHTGRPGCDPAPPSPDEEKTFTLNTSIMAVGEGEYGRLAEQRRYTEGNRRLQLPEPDEQPGAMPEIAPSPDYGRSIDLPMNERAMVLQAWGAYGTAWPVVHHQLGVDPDMGRGRLAVVPQPPSRIAGESIRVGRGTIDVAASPGRTAVELDVKLRRLTLGQVLPHGSRVKSVKLDGRRTRYRAVETNRGLEVLVKAPPRGRHVLTVR
jgi:hypothetical protein